MPRRGAEKTKTKKRNADNGAQGYDEELLSLQPIFLRVPYTQYGF